MQEYDVELKYKIIKCSNCNYRLLSSVSNLINIAFNYLSLVKPVTNNRAAVLSNRCILSVAHQRGLAFETGISIWIHSPLQATHPLSQSQHDDRVHLWSWHTVRPGNLLWPISTGVRGWVTVGADKKHWWISLHPTLLHSALGPQSRTHTHNPPPPAQPLITVIGGFEEIQLRDASKREGWRREWERFVEVRGPALFFFFFFSFPPSFIRSF